MAKGKTQSKRSVKITNVNGKSPGKPLAGQLLPQTGTIENPFVNMINNGLGDALGIGGGNGYGVGNLNGMPGGYEQISEPTTLFKNLRWFLVSNYRQLLSQSYVEIGLIQTIVDLPIDDGLRGGVEIKTKQLDETQIQDLETSVERDNDLVTAGQAAKWNRLFGGGGIVIITDQDPETPLNIDAIGEDTPLEFRAVDMWELFWSKQNTEDYSAVIDGNETEIDTDVEFYDYYGVRLHKSRVMKLIGLVAPSFVRPRLRGWGFSVVESLIRSINQYLKATDLGFEVLDEFKLDVYKIKNLTNVLMSAGGDAKIRQRVAMANWQKNYQNAVVLDGEDAYESKQLSFAGLAEAMEGIRMQVASDMRMPLTKLFGISAAGFSSGEDDIENYNAMIESQVRGKLKFDILTMIELKCQKMFGFVPDDLSIDFKPLRVLSAEQEENVKTQVFNRTLQAQAAGLISVKEFKDAVNRADLLPIQLDTSVETLEVTASQGGDAQEGEDKKPGEADKEKVGDAKKIKSVIDNPPEVPKAKNHLLKPLPVKNSMEYERAAYMTDVPGDRMDLYHKTELSRAKDKDLLRAAKEMSQKAFGEEKWQFVSWYYKRHGGGFGV